MNYEYELRIPTHGSLAVMTKNYSTRAWTIYWSTFLKPSLHSKVYEWMTLVILYQTTSLYAKWVEMPDYHLLLSSVEPFSSTKNDMTKVMIFWIHIANRPVACKDLGMQLEIIARDVTTGCSGCLH